MRDRIISLIVPCLNEESTVEIFYNEILKTFAQMRYGYQLIFVDDGSTDKTLASIKLLAESDENVEYISFSRNFGKEAAMLAGIKQANGIYTAIMDVDLQDPPRLLADMTSILETGEYDVVAARRVTRKGEPLIRSLCARLFYKTMRKITRIDIADGARDFRLMKRHVVDAILDMPERNRFLKGIFGWIGFKTKWIEYENEERVTGETSWTFGGIARYAVEGIINFSEAPLNIASGAGIAMTILSTVALLVIVIRKLVQGDPVAGWASTVCIIIFIGGIQLLCIGIMGKYISKTYIEVKQRPHYIIAEQKCS